MLNNLEVNKIIEFKKNDFLNNDEGITRVKIELDLKYINPNQGKYQINYDTLQEEKSYYVLSISGEIWKGKKNLSCGQNLDDMLPILKHNIKFLDLYYYWRKYHLNNFQSGTLKQQEALRDKSEKLLFADNYSKACKYLRSISLQEDRGVKYGVDWLLKIIPNDMVILIYNI